MQKFYKTYLQINICYSIEFIYRFKKTIYEYMINFLSNKEIFEIETKFKLIDTDGSGNLSMEELKNFMLLDGKNIE